MDKLRDYLNEFFIKGVYLLCSDQPSNLNYSKKLTYEKSFICGSFWSISGLSISSSVIKEEDIVKVLKTLKMCKKDVDVSDNDSRLPSTNTVKAFCQYTDSSLYDCNIQSTLYAIQIYYMVKNLEEFQKYNLDDLMIEDSDIESVVNFIKLLWDKDIGCFYNSLKVSRYNYYDLRHTMSALCAFNLCYKMLNYSDEQILDKLRSTFDTNLMFKFLKSHFNSDGGVSLVPGSQSHAAGAFCCIGSLVFIDKLNSLSHTRVKLLVSWLLERISVSGGMNGRVGKSNDICYIWWNLATLVLIKQKYNKPVKLFNLNVVQTISNFIDESQNQDGGFSSNKSHSSSDPYHSFTAVLSMALLDDFLNLSRLRPIDPLYALPRIS